MKAFDLPWSASRTEYFYYKVFKKGIAVFVEEPLFVFLKLTRGFPISIIFKTTVSYVPAFFHVQYEVSASVTLHRFLCKYLCLLLNYCFRSELPKAFKC